MHRILTAGTTLLLAACANASPIMATQAVAMPEPRAKAQTAVPPPKDRNPGTKREKMLGSGGTFAWKPVTFKVHRQPEEYVATLGYVPNSLGKGTFPMGLQDSRTSFQEFPVPPGVALDWMGVLSVEARGVDVTFDSGDDLFEINGSALDPNTSYSLYIYAADCSAGCYPWTLQSVTLIVRA